MGKTNETTAPTTGEPVKLSRNAWATTRAQAVMVAAQHLPRINAELREMFPDDRGMRDMCRSEIAKALTHCGETLDRPS